MKCPRCEGETVYLSRFDAFACEACNWWVEEQCPDEDCGYCKARPDGPLDLD